MEQIIEDICTSHINSVNSFVDKDGKNNFMPMVRELANLLQKVRVEEWETMGEYLTEADKRAVSSTFIELYRIHGENLLEHKS